MVIVKRGAVVPHQHQASLESSLDFINTLEFSRAADVEHLPDASAAAVWLTEHGLAHAADAERALRDPAALEHLRRVRRAMRELVEAAVDERAADGTALAEVNLALRGRSVIQLEPASDGIALGHRHVGDPVDDALAALIEPLAREIASGRRDRLRVCANDSCRWTFFDESRTGRRRWCDMSTCGNRAKAARHRARRRSAGPPDVSGVAASA